MTTKFASVVLLLSVSARLYLHALQSGGEDSRRRDVPSSRSSREPSSIKR
jgi:hypothetical protein